MASLEDIVKEAKSFSESLNILKNDPSSIQKLFAPILDAGFTDFKWAGAGTSSFFVSPVDNEEIVFRVTSERAPRRNDNPFFLCNAYEDAIFHKASGEELRVELLLAGKKDVSEKDKQFLLDNMRQVGWVPERIKLPDLFWHDVVVVPFRAKNGRMKNIPITSDPSASFNYLDPATPPYQYSKAPNLNSCSDNYITLQDQAATYNAVIEKDERLKKLVPKPIAFEETEVIPTPSVSLPPRS